jgi:soluble lytic murein transglycosylase-like protein
MKMITHAADRIAAALCVALMAVAAPGAARAAPAGGGDVEMEAMAKTRHADIVRLLTGRFRLTEARAEHIVGAVEHAAGKLQVPTSLILAIIQTESSFDPHATSSAGAVGLMQVMPATQRDTAPQTDMRDPASNILVGTSILRRYIDQAGGDIDAALSRYSGGTRGYSQRVVVRWRYFSDFDGSDVSAPASATAASAAAHPEMLVLRVSGNAASAAAGMPAAIRAPSQGETSD